MTRLSDIQPQYFPRLHYFARMLASDVFVIRDDVQFVRNHRYPGGARGVSYQAHTPIKAPAGAHLLTVSVRKGSGLPIDQTGVSYDQSWARKHVNVISNFYRSSPNLRALLPDIERLLDIRFATMADLDIATICWALGRVLGAAPRIPENLSIPWINELLAARPIFRLRRIALGSDCLGPGASPEACTPRSASERILALCDMAGADEYVGGRTALEAYLDADLLRRAGVEVAIQDWCCPVYPQQHMPRSGFIADLSILDLLMNVPAGKVAPLLATIEPLPAAHGRRPAPDEWPRRSPVLESGTMRW
jgi:hypothetical protein